MKYRTVCRYCHSGLFKIFESVGAAPFNHYSMETDAQIPALSSQAFYYSKLNATFLSSGTLSKMYKSCGLHLKTCLLYWNVRGLPFKVWGARGVGLSELMVCLLLGHSTQE